MDRRLRDRRKAYATALEDARVREVSASLARRMRSAATVSVDGEPGEVEVDATFALLSNTGRYRRVGWGERRIGPPERRGILRRIADYFRGR